MTEIDLKSHQYSLEDLHHQILRLLSNESRSSKTLYNDLPDRAKEFISLSDLVTDVTSVMRTEHILSYEDGLWCITSTGMGLLRHLELTARPPLKLSVASKKQYEVASGCYNGAELRDTCLRAGAYDFLAKPSLYGNTLVEHRTASAFFGDRNET